MIPKIIHYCWFGHSPLPDIVQKCLESWQRYMPDYEIRRWDETNIDVNASPFMREAYEMKKFAYVSDYARYKILNDNGGVFLDTDVELIKSFSHLLDNDVVLGINKHVKKNIVFVNPGVFMAATKGSSLINEVLSFYDTLHFIDENGAPDYSHSSPRVLTSILIKRHGFKVKDMTQTLEGNIKVMNSDFFDPINPRKLFGQKLEITENTVAIHHGAASWMPMSKKIKRLLSIVTRNVLGDKTVDKLRGNEKMTYE